MKHNSLYIAIKGIFIRFTEYLKFRKKGQISSSDEIGRWIKMISSLERTEIIVEIGTWNGNGSSKCIVDGILNKKSNNLDVTKVFGFEINKEFFDKAKSNLKKYQFFNVIYGGIITSSELDSSNLNSEESSWFDQDRNNIENGPYVFDKIPSKIHLLILDGGEFSTYREFCKLVNRVDGYIVLDDTKTRKCSRIMEELPSLNSVHLIHESDERNGVAILKTNGYSDNR